MADPKVKAPVENTAPAPQPVSPAHPLTPAQVMQAQAGLANDPKTGHPANLMHRPTAEEISKRVAAIQEEHTKTGAAPLTGTELAEKLAANLAPPPPRGQKYRMATLADVPYYDELGHANPMTAENSKLITSPDGTIEDAVRAYNRGHEEVRTFNQLRVEIVTPDGPVPAAPVPLPVPVVPPKTP